MQLLVAEASSLPSFISRVSAPQIHKFATSRLGDVPCRPGIPCLTLWKSIMVIVSFIICIFLAAHTFTFSS